MAKAAFEAGYRPLFIGFEMSNDEQEERFDAISAHISHYKLRAGTLDNHEWKKLERSVHQLEAMQPFIFSADASSTTTLTGIMGKIEKYEPDIVFVDGVYMMDDEQGEQKGSPQALTNISRGFKRIAQRTNIPVAISTQVLEWKLNRKKGITADSIGYSSSFAQDSDVILGVLGTDDPKTQKLSVVTARSTPRFDTFIQWDWDRGEFTELDGNPFEEEEDGTAPSRSW
jgi:replicative DNA helicase